MRRAIFILLLLLVSSVQAFAQQPLPPDYAVYVVDRQIGVDGQTAILQFGVYNIGGAAQIESEARLYLGKTGDQLLDILTLRPLSGQGDTQIVTFTVPLADLPRGDTSFRLEVGIGTIEDLSSATIGNNRAIVGLQVPVVTPGIATRSPAAETPTPGDETASAAPSETPIPIEILGVEIQIDPAWLRPQNPLLIAGIVALCGVGLILIWMVTVILRLIFRTPRPFETWQPPYAIASTADPNTLAGRRHMWQQHAQSDSLPLPCAEEQFQIRKLLLGLDGHYLSGWRIRGLRLSQYDIYGRVARSQTLAGGGLLRKVGGLARKNGQPSQAATGKRLEPVARRLVKTFLRNINRRTMMLPIACDIRFRGMHGDVRIVFELFRCVGGAYQRVDYWEPEMTIVTGAIQENYTYSIRGLLQGETPKAFRQRLQDELTAALTAMLFKPSAPPTGDTAPGEAANVAPASGEEASAKTGVMPTQPTETHAS